MSTPERSAREPAPYRDPDQLDDNPDESPGVPDGRLPGEDRAEVVSAVEDTEEYAAAAEDDVALPALAPNPPPPERLSGRSAEAEPAKGPE